MKWQRRVRLILAAVAVVSATAVAVSLRPRATVTPQQPVPRTDPKALVESAGGQEIRFNLEREEVRIKYDKLLTYTDGTSKMLGVTVVTERAGGRKFTITGAEGSVGDKESTVVLSGSIRVAASDGLELTTDRATYTKSDGIVTAPGDVRFERGRMKGSGTAFTFDNNQNILTIASNVAVTVAPDRNGGGAMRVNAGTLQFLRNDHVMHFDGGMKAVRDAQDIDADAAVAHLSEDEQRLEALELRGNARITAGKPAPGGLQALNGRDIDLTYSPDGVTLRRAVITGQASMQLAGDADGNAASAGRQIAAGRLDVTVGPDGATPSGLVGRDGVRLVLPATRQDPERVVSSQTLDGLGDDAHGLTAAHLTGNVEFLERGAAARGRGEGPGPDARCQSPRAQPGVAGAPRLACAGTLDLALLRGFTSIDDARFAQNVRFFDGDLVATAASIRYVLSKGTMELRGTEPANPMPHVTNPQTTIDAARIDVTLDGPEVKAAGSVKSVLRAAAGDGSSGGTHMPSMLKPDQPVNVTANDLVYSGAASRAVYTGSAQLWQGDTAIKGAAITIDSKTGDLIAEGPVTTTSVMLQDDDKGGKQRVRSSGSAKNFRYDDDARRATYTGDAHLSGPQGDTAAPRIELYLKESGDEVERAEAYDGVVLRDQNRKTTGTRLTYHSADESYLVTGTPVSIVDECGRETLGRSLTFFRVTDRIIVDGNEQVRTQTKGKSNCP